MSTALMPACPNCGSNSQVWYNQITGLIKCHRLSCEDKPSFTPVSKPHIRLNNGRWKVSSLVLDDAAAKAILFANKLNTQRIAQKTKEHYAL